MHRQEGSLFISLVSYNISVSKTIRGVMMVTVWVPACVCVRIRLGVSAKGFNHIRTSPRKIHILAFNNTIIISIHVCRACTPKFI